MNKKETQQIFGSVENLSLSAVREPYLVSVNKSCGDVETQQLQCINQQQTVSGEGLFKKKKIQLKELAFSLNSASVGLNLLFCEG